MKKLLFLIAIIFFFILSYTSFGQASNGENFAIQNVEIGEINTLINTIMKQTGVDDPKEAIKLVSSGAWILTKTDPACAWAEKDGIIYFSVTSDGTTGKEWITRLESKGFKVSNDAKRILRSEDFKPAKPMIYEIAVLKGELFSNDNRINENIRKEAKNCKLSAPNAEVACLIREKFSDKELEAMGLDYIIAIHDSIKDSNGNPFFLGVGHNDYGSWLGARYGYPDREWDRSHGFAFVSQVSGF